MPFDVIEEGVFLQFCQIQSFFWVLKEYFGEKIFSFEAEFWRNFNEIY